MYENQLYTQFTDSYFYSVSGETTDFDKLSLSYTLSSSNTTITRRASKNDSAMRMLGAHSIQTLPDKNAFRKQIDTLAEHLSQHPQESQKELCIYLVDKFNEATGQIPKLKLESDKSCNRNKKLPTPEIKQHWDMQFRAIKDNSRVKAFNSLVSSKKLKQEPGKILECLKNNPHIPDHEIQATKQILEINKSGQNNNKLIRLIDVVQHGKVISPFALMSAVFEAGHQKVVNEEYLQTLTIHPKNDVRSRQQDLPLHSIQPACERNIAHDSPGSFIHHENPACRPPTEKIYRNLQNIPPYRVTVPDNNQHCQEQAKSKVLEWFARSERLLNQKQQIHPSHPQESVTALPATTATNHINPEKSRNTQRTPPQPPVRRESLPIQSKGEAIKPATLRHTVVESTYFQPWKRMMPVEHNAEQKDLDDILRNPVYKETSI